MLPMNVLIGMFHVNNGKVKENVRVIHKCLCKKIVGKVVTYVEQENKISVQENQSDRDQDHKITVLKRFQQLQDEIIHSGVDILHLKQILKNYFSVSIVFRFS